MKTNLKYIIFFLIFFFVNLTAQSPDTVKKNSPAQISKSKTDTLVIKTGAPKGVVKDSSSITSIDFSKPPVDNIITFGKVFWTIVFLVVGYIIIRVVSATLDKLAEKSTNYRITIKGLVPVVRILGWVLLLYIIIQGIFKPPIATLIAVSASLGIGIGLAAQDLFKNMFGGIMILFDRPFQVGDKIEIGDYYGEVTKIGLRATRIVTGDDSLVSIPNGDIMSKSVSNSNAGEPNCQVVAEIYLPITIDTEKVRQIAIEAAQVSNYIYLNKPITVLFFNEVKERRSYLKMRLKAYVMDIRYELVFKSDMTELVMRELLKQKIILPTDLF